MKKSDKRVKEHHLLMYVEDSVQKIKKFKDPKDLGKFIEDFQKKYPDHLASESGNWVDYAIMNVSGEIHFFTDGIEVE